MENKLDVIAIGELLIDFTDSGTSAQGNTLYEANPGGAPCNVLAMLSKLGRKTGFIGKVGDDFLGNMLKSVLIAAGIDTRYLYFDSERNTTLAFVSKKSNGDREFAFYRNDTADTGLYDSEVTEEYVQSAKLLHFGTLSMSHENSRNATIKAVNIAKKNGLLISFDPNLRFSLFKDTDKLRECIDFGASNADILKISDDEILWFTGETQFDSAVKQLKNKYPNIKLLLLSKGKDGSTAYYKDIEVNAQAFLFENTIELTGAGDTFCGCVLNGVLECGINNLDSKSIKEILTFASAGAGLITTKKGALKVMPTRDEILELINKR